MSTSTANKETTTTTTAIPVWTELQVPSPNADPEDVLAEWWASETALAKSRGIFASEGLIKWEDIAPEEIDLSVDKHFFKRSLRYAAGPIPDQVFALFWSWKKRGKTITVHGGIFPRHIWDKINLSANNAPVHSAIHKSVIASNTERSVPPFRKPLPKPQPHKPLGDEEELDENPQEAASQAGLPIPNLDWIERLCHEPGLYEKTFYLSADASNDPSGAYKPYDGSESMIFRPDELDYYLDYCNKLFYCASILGALEDGRVKTSSSQFANMEAFLLETDLSDPKERELDYKSRLLFASFAARLMLKARSKSKSEKGVKKEVREIPEKDTKTSMMGLGMNRSATESAARLMLQVLAYQYELRHRHLFSTEKDSIRVATMNGSYFWLTENCVSNRRDGIDTLMRMDKLEVQRSAQIRQRLNKPGEIVLCSSSRVAEVLGKRISLYSNSFKKQTEAELILPYPVNHYSDVTIASDHWVSDFNQDVNCSVRFDPETGSYIVASEPIADGLKRLDQKSAGAQDLNLSDLFPVSSSLHSSTFSRSRGLQQVLLSSVPVIFYMLWEANCCQQYGDLLAFVINRLVHEEAFHLLFERESILYYGHKSGELQNTNLYIQSCNGYNYIMVLLPTLVFSNERGLVSFVKAVKHGLSLSHLSAWAMKRAKPISSEISTKIAEKVYAPVDESKTDKALFDGQDCYTPGYRFVYLNNITFEFEVHPSLIEFHHTIYPSSLKHHPILGSIETSTRSDKSTVKIEADCTVPHSDPLADENAKLDVDAWPLPYDEQTKAACDHHETYRFLHSYATREKARIPDHFLMVPIYELNHGSMVSGAQDYSRRSCFYSNPTLGMTCTTCGHPNILCSDRDPNELYQMIHYRQVGMWQFGMFLLPVRVMCKELDRRTKDETIASDLDEFMTKEFGLGRMWTDVVKLLELVLQSMHEVKVEMQIDYELVRRDMDSCRMVISQAKTSTSSPGAGGSTGGGLEMKRTKAYGTEGGLVEVKAPTAQSEGSTRFSAAYDPEMKERIKRYIALKPEDFYCQFKGDKFRITDKDIRWGNHGSFTVLTKKRVVKNKKTGADISVLPGGFVDFEKEDYGDVFKFVMKERYKSDDPSECFTAAVMFCHAYVLRKYGIDALDVDPSERTDVAGKGILDGDVSVNEQNLERRLREARTLWKSSVPFSKDARDGSSAGVKYMKLTRSIHSDRVLFGGAFRFNPSFPLMEYGKSMSFGAVVVSLVNPADPNREIRGVHAIFLDEVLNGKVSYLDQQKKTRGEWIPNGALIQGGSLTDEDHTKAQKEFHCTIAIGEGPETMASIAEACPELEVWSMLGINNIGNFPYLTTKKDASSSETILYCADNDGVTPKHHEKTMAQVKKLTDKGYTVYLVKPELIDSKKDKKADFNDIMTKVLPRADAITRIRETLKKAQVFAPTKHQVKTVKEEKTGTEATVQTVIKKVGSSVGFEVPESHKRKLEDEDIAASLAEKEAIKKIAEQNAPPKAAEQIDETGFGTDPEEIFAAETALFSKSAKKSRLEELAKKKKKDSSSEKKRPAEDESDREERKKEKKKEKKHKKHKKDKEKRRERSPSPELIKDDAPAPGRLKKMRGHVIEDDEDEDDLLKAVL